MTQGEAELRFGNDLRENSSADLLFLLIYLVISSSFLFNSLLLKLMHGDLFVLFNVTSLRVMVKLLNLLIFCCY